jgi:hypothetical protein
MDLDPGPIADCGCHILGRVVMRMRELIAYCAFAPGLLTPGVIIIDLVRSLSC